MNALLLLWIIIKTILLGLLYLAALLAVFASLILLVPVRYEIDGRYEKEFQIRVKAFWFFRFIRFVYQAENQNTNMELNAFGRCLIGKKTHEDQNQDQTPPMEPKAEQELKSSDEENTTAPRNQTEEKDTGCDEDDIDPNESSGEKESLKSKVNRIIDSCIKALEKVKLVINYPDRDELIRLTIRLLQRWMKALQPDLFQLEGEFGFTDPSLTGKCLGGIAMISGLFGQMDSVRIKGNFDKSIFVFALYAKGIFTLWSFVWPLAVYVLSKPVWRIVKPFIFGKNKKTRTK